MAKKALLMILDGWGIGKHGKGDVIFNTPTPYLDLLTATSAHSQLAASGEDVGLPDGQMGNSEVGHLNIGAGRIVYQDLVKINRACKDGSIMENPQVKAAYSYAKEQGKKLHLMGLTSDGGVHSSLDHLFKLIEIGKAYGLKNQVFVHCYMDGRDTDPRSGKGFIQQVSDVCAAHNAAIASIVGRFYAMDPDGTPNTAHSLNPVSFIYVTNNNSATVKDGRLADVAPSILHIMGLEQPADMTGECLIQDNE